MALLRIKSLEGVRYCDPGELGRLVGLDRIPEVKTLRQKIFHLSENGTPEKWSKTLAKYWMEENSDLAGTLYVDGHVRVYHGKQTKLPKQYVSREKLCLRGVTDYWINDALGQPFFVVSKTVNQGILQVLRETIVPQLLEDVPFQPPEKALEDNAMLFRFGIVFDREGYSPDFFKEMWKQRIVCYTYRKYVRQEWLEDEFETKEVVFPNGEVSEMKLAERGVYYQKQKIWFREIRKLTDTGHQTALITTDYLNDLSQISGKMFSRWSQENFFKYMMQHYGIDRLIDYRVENLDDTIKLINPVYRELDSRIRSTNGKLARLRAKYGALILNDEIEEKKIQEYMQKKSDLKDSTQYLEQELYTLKAERKKTDKHISFSDLPEAEKFKALKRNGKQFLDTVKMIAYRSETAMANILKDHMNKKDEARTLVQQILKTDADIEPDESRGILKITLHNMANPRSNSYVEKLCETINSSETIFPGTNLRMVYNSVSNQNHMVQEF